MFEFLPRLAVIRPVLTTMMVVIFLVLGLFSFTRLRTDLFPEVEFPVITVTTAYPGAGPEEIETQVTDRIEEAVSSLANIEKLSSYSQENMSIVMIEFDLSVNVDQAAIDVRDGVEAARDLLPSDAEASVVQRFDIDAFPILDLALFGPQGVDPLYDMADRELSERLSRVEGVASVDVVGGREAEVVVSVDPERLAGYGVTLQDVVDLIRAENVSVPSGRITESRADIPVRVMGEYSSAAEIEDLRLFLPGGGVVRLGELATVTEGFEDTSQLARYNGNPAVSIAIRKTSDANTVTTAEGVRKELEAIRADLPAGADIVVVRDQSQFIQSSVNDVLSNLLIGILLTTLVLFLFLHSWRGTVIAAAAMPVTVVSTFLLVDTAGFTLNIMTLMALSITVGILVTNTIVVLENISRHMQRGEDSKVAARKGTAEIGVAVAASTLTNLVVFTPIAFMGGIIGQFFYAFGLTVVFATLFSIFISFTLAPMLAARLLRKEGAREGAPTGRLAPLWRRWDETYQSLENAYRTGLDWALARPRNGWFVIAGVLTTSLVVMMVATRFVGGEFLPPGDEDAVQVTLEMPSGTAIEQTGDAAAAAEQLIRDMPDVDATLTTIAGGDFTGIGGGANIATLLVTLVDEPRPTDDVVRETRLILAGIPDADVIVKAIDPGAIGGGAEAPLQIQISGPDYELLRDLADQTTDRLEQLPELGEVTNTLEEPRTELTFRPDRAALADGSVTVGEVGNVVRSAIEGSIAGVFRGDVGRERDIRVRLSEDARQQAAQVGDLEVRTSRGRVQLRSLGELVEASAATSIQREERIRAVTIDAQLGDAPLTAAAAAIGQSMDADPLPPGYSWKVTGDFEEFGDALGSMLVALVLAIVLTYIVLAMILESFIHPFTIMLTLPLGVVGAVLGLFLWGSSLNIFSMMAIIMLVGIVVNNAILILDYTAQLRREGMRIVEALLEAAPTRLRPIVMTNIAIVFALLPQAIATGAGANFRVPMAVVTIGGVLLSAVFTLLLIPVIYTKLDRFDLAKSYEQEADEDAAEPAYASGEEAVPVPAK